MRLITTGGVPIAVAEINSLVTKSGLMLCIQEWINEANVGQHFSKNDAELLQVLVNKIREYQELNRKVGVDLAKLAKEILYAPLLNSSI